MPNPEHIYFNAFCQIGQIGSVRFRKLLNHFDSMETAWRAPVQQLREAGLEEPVLNLILDARAHFDPENEFAALQKQNIKLLTIREEQFPRLLKEIPNPPVVLYMRGDLSPRDEMAIAVVGTRNMTAYGRQVAEDIVRDLVRANLTVVSGLALGIDAVAHKITTEFNGRTIAVLGSGVDNVYPASNRVIAEKILTGSGAVISELPPGSPPLKHHFPNRNRIISGLALGTLVIEAAEDSGALITARHALEQNRQVFAVPGSILSPVSVGPNNLLKMGAKPVTSARDILEELNLGTLQEQLVAEEVVGDNAEEEKILSLLNRVPKHFDLIAKSSGLAASIVASTLTIMEMKGKVRNLGGNQYVKSR
ncbi:MAG: DNA-processing protein DprA [Candidatus Doudnabacteria bacterium]|nr:DNA-processing protein DprA [bacterium]MDZ4244040.1 DNA-processing protein DprA [Candidatus Doudnabacteria bacterium]